MQDQLAWLIHLQSLQLGAKGTSPEPSPRPISALTRMRKRISTVNRKTLLSRVGFKD